MTGMKRLYRCSNPTRFHLSSNFLPAPVCAAGTGAPATQGCGPIVIGRATSEGEDLPLFGGSVLALPCKPRPARMKKLVRHTLARKQRPSSQKASLNLCLSFGRPACSNKTLVIVKFLVAGEVAGVAASCLQETRRPIRAKGQH